MDEWLYFIWANCQNVGVVCLDTALSLRAIFTDDHLLGLFQQDTLQCTDASESRTNNQHGVPFGNLGDIRRPVTNGQDIFHKQCLPVCDRVRYFGKPLVNVGHPDILRLSFMLAEKAISTEGFYIDHYPIPGLNSGNVLAYCLHNPHHLMAYCDPWNGPGQAAMLDV